MYRIGILALPLVLSACSSAMRTPAAPEAATGVPPLARIYDTKAERFVTFEQMSRALTGADLVFFGELHDDQATHAAELAVLAALGERRAPVVLSLEMFERDVQSLLDSYLSGRISEKDFLAGSRPWPNYASDYRAMIELARIRGWPVVASNIPRRLASAIGRQGLTFFDTLNVADRVFTAAENLCPRDIYYEKFTSVMGGAGGHGGGATQDSAAARATVDRFYEAQCVKDETMGESIARALTAAGDGAVVLHINGAFHSDFRLGTVDRALRRLPRARSVVITTVRVANPEAADPREHLEKADFVIFTRVVK